MNSSEEKYTRFSLVREMLETPGIIRKFNPKVVSPFIKKVKAKKGLFLTGEGSSRIFPAKRARYYLLKSEVFLPLVTEGATQALEYPLNDFAVFAASNSGKTKEVIRFVHSLRRRNHGAIFGVTATPDSKLRELIQETYLLSCGQEKAVAATKSVIEQGLFYDALVRELTGQEMSWLPDLADKVEETLSMPVSEEIIEKIKSADMIYFAGRNNGVAEELALKTSEITRKKSAFLEGTFAVHGIEEVMNKNEVLIWIESFTEEEEKFEECLVKGAGINIISISGSSSKFRGMRIPYGGQYSEYIQLAAGWNLLVETGLALGVDLDKPVRARKIGNEFIPA